MDELINSIKEVSSLSQIKNVKKINPNILLVAIAKSERYDLLKGSNLVLNTADSKTFEMTINFLLSDVDTLYYMRENGFSLSKDEVNAAFDLIKENNQDKLDNFIINFFNSKEEKNDFVNEHEDFFKKYLEKHSEGFTFALKDSDKFTELILKSGNIKLLNHLENYSLDNLKLLARLSKSNKNISYILGNEQYAQHIFDMKESFSYVEFYALLDLLKEKSLYDRKFRDGNETSFSILVKNNMDYLITMASKNNSVPKCLAESTLFRDECIKRNRIDLASKCLLPMDVIKDESLVNAYCKELNIKPKDFHERYNQILSYHKKNSNVFNTLLSTSLKDNIFNLNKEHFERFANDVQIQLSISKLNDNELNVLSLIFKKYNYNDFDISSMIVNIVNYIHDYSKLIDSINIKKLSEQDLKSLVSVLQLPNNEYKITSIRKLKKYNLLKKKSFSKKASSDDLISNKNSLLKTIFNVDLEEAKYIDFKYCYRNDNSCVLGNLKNSELPPQIYNYLTLINQIVNCESKKELANIYKAIKDSKIYDCEIPLEAYLRSKYTELYSKSLYKVNGANQMVDSKDNEMHQISYNGKNVQIYVPKDNFNFFVHCVGSCSLASDVTDKNYSKDWLDRPQIHDHFVACSYINERGIYSIRSQGSIILGFDSLENGSILAMGNTDIDSIGSYSTAYDGSRRCQKENGNRARFFVPSEMLKTINDGYNEIVVERRNTNIAKSKEFKRKPDYIIMMANSENLNSMNSLYNHQLSFISEEDRKELQQYGNGKEIKNFLLKYKEVIAQKANEKEIKLNDMANMYVSLILEAKYFEDCLKASSEFDVPLVVANKSYYFNKILFESESYDDKTKKDISELYLHSISESQRRKIFDTVAKEEDVSQLLPSSQVEPKNITIKK